MENKAPLCGLIKEDLGKWLAGAEKLMILGIGNELRGDDSAGLLVARALKRFNGERFEAVECGGSIEDCISYAFEKRPSHLLIVDAFADGLKIVLLDLADLESRIPVSTHAIPLRLLIEAFGGFTETSIKVLGIGVANFEFGAKISSECLKIVDETVRSIREAAASSGLIGEE